MSAAPLEQVARYAGRIGRHGYDHPDFDRLCELSSLAARFISDAQGVIAQMEDASLRADLLDPIYGLCANVSDGIGTAAAAMETWDETRGDREQDARDNRAADAADARIDL